MANMQLNQAIMEVLDNQLKADNPKEVKITLQRLLDEGIAEEEARKRIAVILVEEIYDVLQSNLPYDENRYISKLKKL